MSQLKAHRKTIALALIGAAAGAWVGLGYFDDGGRCASSLLESEVACRLNHAWIPFIGMIIVGVLVALGISALLARADRLLPQSASAPPGSPLPDGEHHDLDEELQAMVLSGEELGLERSEPEPGPEPVRIGERGRPVPQPRPRRTPRRTRRLTASAGGSRPGS